MNLYVGTSGFSYKEWNGTFYPPGLPSGQMLHYYSERFLAVEINNTFYRMPKQSILEAWASRVPDGFRFVLKAPRQITHVLQLRDAAESVGHLLKTSDALGGHLGPILFQLPPYLKKDVPLLDSFVSLLPEHYLVAFEFRHESWFDDEVSSLLERHHSALCIADADDGLHVPFTSTAAWGYLRLRRRDYSDGDLQAWAKRVRDQEWQDVYIFFKHEEEGKGPKLAQRFLTMAAG